MRAAGQEGVGPGHVLLGVVRQVRDLPAARLLAAALPALDQEIRLRAVEPEALGVALVVGRDALHRDAGAGAQDDGEEQGGGVRNGAGERGAEHAWTLWSASGRSGREGRPSAGSSPVAMRCRGLTSPGPICGSSWRVPSRPVQREHWNPERRSAGRAPACFSYYSGGTGPAAGSDQLGPIQRGLRGLRQ